MLFVSFWHMSSANLPEGTFHKRRLALEEVRVLVTRAREAGQLVCTAKEDLAAPYQQAALQRHIDLCQVLKKLEIPIEVPDFFGEVCSNVLQFAYVGKRSDLLFLDCCYALNRPRSDEGESRGAAQACREAPKESSRFAIDPTSVTFDLYSMVEVEVLR